MTQKYMQRITHTIDATGKISGRLATEIARLIIGKHKPSYQPNKDEGDFVEVTNVDKMIFTGKKLEQKTYKHHSGFLGGLKTKTIKEFLSQKPEKILTQAVSGMLPKNKLRVSRLKRLLIKK